MKIRASTSFNTPEKPTFGLFPVPFLGGPPSRSQKHYSVDFCYEIIIGDFTTNVIKAADHASLGQVVKDEGVVNCLADPTLDSSLRSVTGGQYVLPRITGFSAGICLWLICFYH